MWMLCEARDPLRLNAFVTGFIIFKQVVSKFDEEIMLPMETVAISILNSTVGVLIAQHAST